jgi:hypothetical protein
VSAVGVQVYIALQLPAVLAVSESVKDELGGFEPRVFESDHVYVLGDSNDGQLYEVLKFPELFTDATLIVDARVSNCRFSSRFRPGSSDTRGVLLTFMY